MDTDETDGKSWVDYKRRKMHFFVDQGYSVEWTRDESNWLAVYTPQNSDTSQPELRAMVKCFHEPSKFGIDGGRISKVHISTRYRDVKKEVLGQPCEQVTTLYNYDRGPDVDRIKPDSSAARLLTVILRELN